MSSKKAESKRNGLKRCEEETSSQGSSIHPNTQTREINTRTRKNFNFFSQMSSKEAKIKRSGLKRCREETSSQGSSTHPEFNTQTRKINKKTRKIRNFNTTARKVKNKEMIVLEYFNPYENACGKCHRCSFLPTPTFPTSDERRGDASFSTFSKSIIDSLETTAAVKKNEGPVIDQLYYLYNNGKVNDGDLKKALKDFKENTTLRDIWLLLKEELQVEWVKEDVEDV